MCAYFYSRRAMLFNRQWVCVVFALHRLEIIIGKKKSVESPTTCFS